MDVMVLVKQEFSYIRQTLIWPRTRALNPNLCKHLENRCNKNEPHGAQSFLRKVKGHLACFQFMYHVRKYISNSQNKYNFKYFYTEHNADKIYKWNAILYTV